MSGGHFDYEQYRLNSIAESIQVLIETNDDTTLNEFGDTRGYNFPEDIIDEFRKAAQLLKQAYAYVATIDYLVCGDYGEDTFRKVLQERLAAIETDNTKE